MSVIEDTELAEASHSNAIGDFMDGPREISVC